MRRANGARPELRPGAQRRILAILDQPPPAGYANRTAPLLARALSDVHEQYIWCFLRARKIDLSGRKSWRESSAPEFVDKAAEIVGLYMAPSENASCSRLMKAPQTTFCRSVILSTSSFSTSCGSNRPACASVSWSAPPPVRLIASSTKRVICRRAMASQSSAAPLSSATVEPFREATPSNRLNGRTEPGADDGVGTGSTLLARNGCHNLSPTRVDHLEKRVRQSRTPSAAVNYPRRAPSMPPRPG